MFPLLSALVLPGSTALALLAPQSLPEAPSFDCGSPRMAAASREYRRKALSGEIAPRPAPETLPPGAQAIVLGPGLATADDFFLFEDTASILTTNFSDAQLIALMVDAINALLAAHGDVFDFAGFFLSYDPDHTIGAAFYFPVQNDVSGIGDPGAPVGEPPIFDSHVSLGLSGTRLEGWVMMWFIDNGLWFPGSGPSASITRLVLGQEFEHRFALYLPDLLDGRVMQGDDAICGRTLHWNWQIDGQGSGMEISEWTGTNPAVPTGLSLSFNTDIAGSVFSYSDLYLMGYVTAAEMDAGNSELRFMQGSDCSSDFFGTISAFSSADIIAASGPRVPSSAAEDQDYCTGWIMIHLPGQPPTGAQLNSAAGILNQHQSDWNLSTLGRGTMDNRLPGGSIIPPVPTLGPVGLALMVLCLSAGGAWTLQRRRRRS